MMRFQNENIWIIGASSGIGHALALQLSALGAHLTLSARNYTKLQELQNTLQQRDHIEHDIAVCDVTNHAEIKNICGNFNTNNIQLHRVIFMSALYQPTSITNMDIETACQIVDTNIKSIFYLINEVLPIFEQQKSGQIALCGSVAGYIGLPNGQPYSATKAAIINFAETLHAETPDYIDVKLINPGFVETPMTAKNSFNMPMIITAEQAAKLTIKGFNKNIFEIHYPKRFTYFLKLLQILPYRLKLLITSSINH